MHARLARAGEHETPFGKDLMRAAHHSLPGNPAEAGCCASLRSKTREETVSSCIEGGKEQRPWPALAQQWVERDVGSVKTNFGDHNDGKGRKWGDGKDLLLLLAFVS